MKKEGRERGKEEGKKRGRDSRKKRRGERATKMTSVMHSNSMVKSFPQQVMSEMKANDRARLFK